MLDNLRLKYIILSLHFLYLILNKLEPLFKSLMKGALQDVRLFLIKCGKVYAEGQCDSVFLIDQIDYQTTEKLMYLQHRKSAHKCFFSASKRWQ